jgi:hypothetical protein
MSEENMDFYDQRLPRKEGWISIRMGETALKCLLADLESQSKQHRKPTLEFKKIAKGWLKRCEDCRNCNEDTFP